MNGFFRKKFLGVMMIFFCAPFSVNANWYTPSTTDGFDRAGGLKRFYPDSGIQSCPEDAYRDIKNPTDIPPRLNTDSQLGYHSGGRQVQAIGMEVRGGYRRGTYIKCKQWDSTRPHNGKINYHNGWTNNQNIVLNISANDFGGSMRINSDVRIEIQVSNAKIFENGRIGNFARWGNINPRQDVLNVGGRGAHGNISYVNARYTYSVGRTEGTAYKFRFRLRDGAGNYTNGTGINPDGWIESPNIYKLDTEPPKVNKIYLYPTKSPNPNSHKNIGDISDDPNNNFYAGEDFPLTIEYRNSDGAPIKIEYTIEDDNYPNRMNNGIVNFTYKTRLKEKFDKVDNNRERRGGNIGGRQIFVIIGRITDEAGNSLIVNKTKQFYVFANITSAQVACKNSGGYYACDNPLSVSNRESTNAFPKNSIADGKRNSHSQVIIDKYGNIIIPAPRIKREIKRFLSTHWNKMYLNQKLRGKGDKKSSVYFHDNNNFSLGEKELPIADRSEKWAFNGQIQNSSDGKYGFDISVYTPTANSYNVNDPVSDPEAEFAYQYWLTVSDDASKIGTPHGRNNPKEVGRMKIGDANNPQYAPPFTNKISGDIRDGGFIEGVEQENILKITKNPQANLNPVPKAIYAEYSGDNADNFTLSKKSPNPTLDFDKNNYKQFIPNFIIGNHNFSTFVKQKVAKVNDTSKMFFSTHFVYNLNGKNVTYNGDVIGKKSYFGAEETNQGNQVGVKIIGTANDARLNFILNNQENNIHSVNISRVSSAEVRNEIRRSVALATRNLQLENAGKNIVDVANIPSGSGMKAGIVNHDSGKSSILLIQGNGEKIELTAEKISGKRTIVVQNADLYIKKDMYYDPLNKNSILGVVVQKGENGGGNLYIDTGITNVVGTYVLDGSVFSAKNGNEISIGKISDLKNQLYIFGSLISYNTIGGARTNPPTCPLFITNCNENDAQKYDLNYLRRYYLFGGKPLGGAKIIGGREYNRTTDKFSGAKSHLSILYNDLTSDLAKYPVIIEYNPRIVTDSPIGFDIFRE